MNFQSLRIEFKECEEDWRGREIEERLDQSSFLRTLVLDPKFWFCTFFSYHATRAQPTKLFATDSMAPLPFSPDGRSRDAELRAAAREAEVAALCAAARAAEARAEAAEATLEVARAGCASTLAELEKAKKALVASTKKRRAGFKNRKLEAAHLGNEYMVGAYERVKQWVGRRPV